MSIAPFHGGHNTTGGSDRDLPVDWDADDGTIGYDDYWAEASRTVMRRPRRMKNQ